MTVSAVFAKLGWATVFRTLEGDLRAEFAWIWPATVALGAVGIICAIVCFVAASTLGKDERNRAERIVADMDDLRAMSAQA